MLTLTDQILASVDKFATLDEGFEAGATDRRHVSLEYARQVWASIRARHGFKEIPSDLLTQPTDNLKLDKGEMPAYGLTLQHYVTNLGRLPGSGNRQLVVNACPNAGDCTKVCVLDNGNGRYDKVQRARKAKTEFLATQPHLFVFLLGYELARAVRKHGKILLRPNVNSDVEWERVLPSLTQGTVFGEAVWSYGYTKLESVLDTDGYLGAAYRVAFSCSERMGLENQRVWNFLAAGGSVAVVTNRKPKAPVSAWALPLGVNTVDADVSDEWVFGRNVIGDLSAKGKARSLIGKSGFVLGVYA
jgi:hypothetical protein